MPTRTRRKQLTRSSTSAVQDSEKPQLSIHDKQQMVDQAGEDQQSNHEPEVQARDPHQLEPKDKIQVAGTHQSSTKHRQAKVKESHENQEPEASANIPRQPEREDHDSEVSQAREAEKRQPSTEAQQRGDEEIHEDQQSSHKSEVQASEPHQPEREDRNSQTAQTQGIERHVSQSTKTTNHRENRHQSSEKLESVSLQLIVSNQKSTSRVRLGIKASRLKPTPTKYPSWNSKPKNDEENARQKIKESSMR